MTDIESSGSFFTEAVRVHHGQYTYDYGSFTNMSSKISAYCPIHKKWWYPIAKAHIGYGNRRPSTCPLPGCRTDKRGLNREGLIAYMKDKFGSTQFNYSLVTNERDLRAREIIQLICPVHGIFSCMLHNHKRGQGCPTCNKRLVPLDANIPLVTFDDVTEAKASQEFHVQFELFKKYGIDLAMLHKERMIIFNDLPKELDQVHARDEMVALAVMSMREVHGNAYQYHFGNDIDRVELECKHGRYRTTVLDHILGIECPKCVIEKKGYTTQLFILRAKRIHGYDKIDYSTAKYVNAKAPIQLKCREHGLFEVMPDSHTRVTVAGHSPSCPRCTNVLHTRDINLTISRPEPLTTETFIAKAKAISRPTILDYSEVDYQNNDLKVKIRCPIHGWFYQEAGSHIRSRNAAGCPGCSKYGLDISKPASLYYAKLIHTTGEVFYKIGITQRDPYDRLYCGKDLRFQILMTESFVRTEDAKERESQILTQFAEDRCKRPDIIISGWTELFDRDILGLDFEASKAS